MHAKNGVNAHKADKEFYDYSDGLKVVYYNGEKIEPISDENKCKKLDEKICKGKKCKERQLVVGQRTNENTARVRK